MEQLVAALTTFALIAPVELPDKTFVATLVLATRFRGGLVWLGVVTAFALQVGIAVVAGGLLSLLPTTPVQLVAAALFAVGAVVLLRGARRADAAEREQEREFEEKIHGGRTGWRAIATSFLVLFTAEWGDLSQLFTAGLVARGEPPVAVFIGAWAALAVVSGAAVLLGRWLLRRIRLALVRYLAAGVCAILSVLTVITVIT